MKNKSTQLLEKKKTCKSGKSLCYRKSGTPLKNDGKILEPVWTGSHQPNAGGLGIDMNKKGTQCLYWVNEERKSSSLWTNIN